MKSTFKALGAVGAALAASLTFAVLTAQPASAATYVENVTAAPSSLTCTVAADLESCGGLIDLFNPQASNSTGTYSGGSGIFYANAGDTATVNLTYTGTLDVPNSKTVSATWIDLIAWTGVVGFLPLEDANVSTTLDGYVGPANPFTTYLATDYLASAGHYFAAGNPGAFSITGMSSTFTFVDGESYPIVAVGYGCLVGVPEPATWATMLLGFFALGAVLRMRRARPAAA